MKRKLLFSILLIALCFYLHGCGDEGVLNLNELVATAPSAELEGVIGPVPDRIKAIIWGEDVDTMLTELETAVEAGKDIDHYIHAICYRRAREAYYEKYISAGGIVIMGHGYIDDRFFYAAREIALGMTRKRPELRALLTPSRENRPGAKEIDTRHDVTGRSTPSRKFRMILVHNSMSLTSVPEYYLGNGVVQYRVAPGLGSFWPSWAWAYVGGSTHSEQIWIQEVFSHELAHAIHAAIRLIDPTFDDRLQEAYEATKGNPLVLTTTRRSALEYWAHAASNWFSKVATQAWYHDRFRENEPLMYALLSEWFDLIDLSAVETKVYD